MKARKIVRRKIKRKNQFFGIEIDNSEILALTAVIVSIISISISARYYSNALTLQRNHNKVSVRPYLRFFTSNLEPAIRLENFGYGPAFIDSIVYTLDDSIVLEHEPSVWFLVEQDFGLDTLFWKYNNISVLKGEDKINLLQIDECYCDQFTLELKTKLLDSIRSRMEIRVYYQSIYGEEGISVW